MNKLFTFALENPKLGGFPLPLVSDFYFESPSDFPNPNRNRYFHKALGFHFSYSLQGFRSSLCQSLLTMQRYELILKYTNYFKIIYTFSAFLSLFFLQ